MDVHAESNTLYTNRPKPSYVLYGIILIIDIIV